MMTMIHAVTAGRRTTPSISSAHVSNTNAAIAHQRLRNARGSRRHAPVARAVHSLSAPKGQATHHTRPATTSVKMTPAHQIVHVRRGATLTRGSCTSTRPRKTTAPVTISSGSCSAGFSIGAVSRRASLGTARRSSGATGARAAASRIAASASAAMSATPASGHHGSPACGSTSMSKSAVIGGVMAIRSTSATSRRTRTNPAACGVKPSGYVPAEPRSTTRTGALPASAMRTSAPMTGIADEEANAMSWPGMACTACSSVMTSAGCAAWPAWESSAAGASRQIRAMTRPAPSARKGPGSVSNSIRNPWTLTRPTTADVAAPGSSACAVADAGKASTRSSPSHRRHRHVQVNIAATHGNPCASRNIVKFEGSGRRRWAPGGATAPQCAVHWAPSSANRFRVPRLGSRFARGASDVLIALGSESVSEPRRSEQLC